MTDRLILRRIAHWLEGRIDTKGYDGQCVLFSGACPSLCWRPTLDSNRIGRGPLYDDLNSAANCIELRCWAATSSMKAD